MNSSLPFWFTDGTLLTLGVDEGAVRVGNLMTVGLNETYGVLWIWMAIGMVVKVKDRELVTLTRVEAHNFLS